MQNNMTALTKFVGKNSFLHLIFTRIRDNLHIDIDKQMIKISELFLTNNSNYCLIICIRTRVLSVILPHR